MSILFSSLTIKSITLKNRLVVSPMCQYSSQDGFANDWHLVHLGSRAVGGAALVMQEATAVTPEGRISYQDLGIWKDEHIPKLQQIVSFIHAQGSIAGIQLAHAGRKASVEVPWKGGQQLQDGPNSWTSFAPSSIAFDEKQVAPAELSPEGIHKVINDFRTAAARALKVGYKVIELHGAHGYLLHQFLSPLSNHRTDEYGGSFTNRTRLLLEVVAAIQEEWPADLPLFVRLSATDYKDGGWNIDESVQLAVLLKAMGVDLIDASSGGVVPGVKIPLVPGYQVPFASQIKKQAGILTGAVGLITDAKQSEAILQNGDADVILMARELLRDPYFPMRAAAQLGEDGFEWPAQYRRARR